MATYYVDPNGGYGWTNAQNGSSGNPWLGCAGFQKAINTVAAGDIVLIRGGTVTSPLIADSKYWWNATTTNDKSGTWAVGDVVQNNTGSGNHWTGVIFAIAAKVITISCTTGDYTTVTTSEGIANTTRSDADTFTKANAMEYVWATSGSATAQIRTVGCDGSYNANAGFAKFINYGGNIFFNGNTKTYNTIENCILDGNGVLYGYGIYGYRNVTIIKNCWVYNVARYTISSGYVGSKAIGCILGPNTSSTTPMVFGFAVVANCLIKSAVGVGVASVDKLINSVVYNSGFNNITAVSGMLISGCVIDKSGAGYSNILVNAVNEFSGILNNRITNGATYGIELASADKTVYEDYNYFQSNASGNLLNVTAGLNSVAGSDTNCGFADANYATTRDYTLAANATLRRQLINLDWNLSTPLNKLYATAGITPSDGGTGIFIPWI